MDVFAAELSRLCPLLEAFYSEGALLSPAQNLVPQPQVLNLGKTRPGLRPSRFDKIEARHGSAWAGNWVSRCIVGQPCGATHSDAFASRIKSLYLSDAALPWQLRLAASLEVLKDILFPDNFSASPEFFKSLARAPLSRNLFWGPRLLADGVQRCARILSSRFTIDWNDTLTPDVVDIILGVRPPTYPAHPSHTALSSAGMLASHRLSAATQQRHVRPEAHRRRQQQRRR